MRYGALVRRCVLALCAIIAVPSTTSAQRDATPVSAAADAVAAALAREAPAPLRRIIEEMHRGSATFRRQCLRLAVARRVRIQMQLDMRLPAASWRARTRIDRRDGQIVAAHVLLPLSLQAVELIAHELEHILEQLDGVDLDRHVETGVVWKNSEGAFETARAIAIGRRVAQEVEAGARLVAVRR